MENKELYALCVEELKNISEKTLLNNGIKSLRLIQEASYPSVLIISMAKTDIRIKGEDDIISKIKEIKNFS
jgi:hypothetical protein